MSEFSLIACLRRFAVLLGALACVTALPAPAFATARASGSLPGRVGDSPAAHRECSQSSLGRVPPRMDDARTGEARFLIATDPQSMASDSCRDRSRPECG